MVSVVFYEFVKKIGEKLAVLFMRCKRQRRLFAAPVFLYKAYLMQPPAAGI